MIVTKKDGKLIIEVPLIENPKPSSTGKTLIVASSNGAATTNVLFNDKVVRLTLSAYIKAD